MQQQAFNKEHRMLKGGLHCHTTRSDGRGTPEEVERLHARHGYDFLALTDHNFYNYADYAPETGLLIIPGMEIDAEIEKFAKQIGQSVEELKKNLTEGDREYFKADVIRDKAVKFLCDNAKAE